MEEDDTDFPALTERLNEIHGGVDDGQFGLYAMERIERMTKDAT